MRRGPTEHLATACLLEQAFAVLYSRALFFLREHVHRLGLVVAVSDYLVPVVRDLTDDLRELLSKKAAEHGRGLHVVLLQRSENVLVTCPRAVFAGGPETLVRVL